MADQRGLAYPGGEPRELLPHDGSAILFESFLPADDADILFDELLHGEPWEDHHLTIFGRRVSEPRRSVWHADDGFAYRYSGADRRTHPWSPTLRDLAHRCGLVAGEVFNGVLVNLYRDGHDSMGWHSDDEPELGPEPIIASLSLGAERAFDLRHRDSGETVRAFLSHGSLLVMSGSSQHRWRHRVPRTARTRSARINLTFRRLLCAG